MEALFSACANVRVFSLFFYLCDGLIHFRLRLFYSKITNRRIASAVAISENPLVSISENPAVLISENPAPAVGEVSENPPLLISGNSREILGTSVPLGSGNRVSSQDSANFVETTGG